MARLALCLALLLAAPACFIPPGDPFFANRAPQVLDAAPALPVVTVPFSTVSPCHPLEFSAAVADADVEDLLRYRFYVDDVQVAEGVLYNPEQRATRVERPSWKVVPTAPGSPLARAGTHLVELLVADTDILGRVPAPRDRLLDGGVVPAGSDLGRWLVEVPSPPPVCP